MKIRDFLILAGGVAAASQVSALSLGNSQGNVQLGSPLDLVFQVHADAGQTAQSSCISADVWMGDTPLGSSQVLLTTQDKSVRIRTTAPVYEPLITLKLSAGCTGAVSRSYTFFADPPSAMTASLQPIDLSKIQFTPIAAARANVPAIQADKPVRSAKRAVNPKALKESSPSLSSSSPTAAAVAAAVNTPILDGTTETTQNLSPSDVSTSPNADKPRLRIDPLEGLERPQSLVMPATSPDAETPALIASAAIDLQTQALLTANASRLEALEQQLQALQQQLRSNHSEISGLQTQLLQAQNTDLPIWVYLMLGLLALALATIAWLILRIKQARRISPRSWTDTVLAADHSEHTTSVDTRADTVAAQSASANVEPPLVAPQPTAQFPAATPVQTTTPATVKNSSEAPAFVTAPDVHHSHLPNQELAPLHAPTPSTPSIAEVLTAQALFDVQEQAEFYASIGENDQAISILQTHIAEHEASSPLAYIELLQLLYRLSRTDAYEEVREKFQNHFNVHVPDFLGFIRKGRDLWSGHPDVLSQIEAQWPTNDVQTLLHNLILRRNATGFTEAQIRFDLAAFDDLLMLYNVAKTTPASSRGQLPGRKRTAPTEVPLPDLVLDPAVSAPISKYQPQSVKTTPLASPPLPLADAYLDLLSAGPAQAPMVSPTHHTDSPPQTPSHFMPNEALMDGLSLELDIADLGMPPPAGPTTHTEQTQALDALEAELRTFMLDKPDTPKEQRSAKDT